MPFEWPQRPDSAQVVLLSRESTSEGLPCQVHVILEFTKDGKVLGRRRFTVNRGLLSEYGIENPEERFKTLWNSIPEASDAVKEAVRDRLPDEMLRDLWRGRRL